MPWRFLAPHQWLIVAIMAVVLWPYDRWYDYAYLLALIAWGKVGPVLERRILANVKRDIEERKRNGLA